MIQLSNGRVIKDFVALSGALAFSCLGYFWERPLVWLGIIKPDLFTVILKTLTYIPRAGNLRWWKPWTWLPFSPWSCVRFLPGGALNKVGLTNPGLGWWKTKVAPKINFQKQSIIVSIYSDDIDQTLVLVVMIEELNRYKLTGVELNISCSNTGHAKENADHIISTVKVVAPFSHHPIGLKLSADQEYLKIASALSETIEWISINSVPFGMVYPNNNSPVEKVGPEGSGKGGVSGKPAQHHNWKMIEELAEQGAVPVIASSVMSYDDVLRVRSLGASSVGFGALFMRKPWLPTQIVKKDIQTEKH